MSIVTMTNNIEDEDDEDGEDDEIDDDDDDAGDDGDEDYDYGDGLGGGGEGPSRLITIQVQCQCGRCRFQVWHVSQWNDWERKHRCSCNKPFAIVKIAWCGTLSWYIDVGIYASMVPIVAAALATVFTNQHLFKLTRPAQTASATVPGTVSNCSC